MALIAGLICIAGLFLPTEGEGNPNVPECLHLAVNFKLIFAFVLGTYVSKLIKNLNQRLKNRYTVELKNTHIKNFLNVFVSVDRF